MTHRADIWGTETQWSMIRRAASDKATAERDEAWRQFIARYREPVRRTLRWQLWQEQVKGADQACDDFFSFVASKGLLPKANPETSSFRAYIQVVIKNYVRNSKRKRGRLSSLDTATANAIEDKTIANPGASADHHWTMGFVAHSLAMLKTQDQRGAELLTAIFGLDGTAIVPREVLARERGVTRSAIDQAFRAAKKRLDEIITAELRETVHDELGLREEIEIVRQRLIEALSEWKE